MNIIGFNFTKINAVRKRTVLGGINITNNISLKDIVETQIGIGDAERKTIKISFVFSSEYTPDMAVLSFEGDVLVLLERKLAEDVAKNWAEKKQIPPAVAQRVMNHVLDRCNVQAMILARDLGLPSPIPLPQVNVQVPKSEKVYGKKDEKKDDKKAKKK